MSSTSKHQRHQMVKRTMWKNVATSLGCNISKRIYLKQCCKINLTSIKFFKGHLKKYKRMKRDIAYLKELNLYVNNFLFPFGKSQTWHSFFKPSGDVQGLFWLCTCKLFYCGVQGSIQNAKEQIWVGFLQGKHPMLCLASKGIHRTRIGSRLQKKTRLPAFLLSPNHADDPIFTIYVI